MNLETLLLQIQRSARNALIDIRYGGLLLDRRNSDYQALSYIFADRIKRDDVFVDIGCGKGRVINWWLNQQLTNRIIGIELDEKIAQQTRQRLRGYKNVTIITGDAVQNIPADGTLFFLFNSFGRPVVEAFKQRLFELFGQRGGITICYYNCLHVDLFQQDPAWQVEVFEVGEPSPIPFSRCAIVKLQQDSIPTKARPAPSLAYT